jgi:hypothetical protein
MSRIEEGNPLSIWRITYETVNQIIRSSELVAFSSLIEARDYGLERAKSLDLVLRAVDQWSVASEDQRVERQVEKTQSQRPMQ